MKDLLLYHDVAGSCHKTEQALNFVTFDLVYEV